MRLVIEISYMGAFQLSAKAIEDRHRSDVHSSDDRRIDGSRLVLMLLEVVLTACLAASAGTKSHHANNPIF